MTNITSKTRLIRIDMMIGMAMALVVLGHFSIGFEPGWYHPLHNWIYSFHMQMFLFLSAFLIRYTYKPVETIGGYFRYIWRKFRKFFLPFILVGFSVALLACVVKDKTLNWNYVGHSLKMLFLYPRWSETSFLWYIYILFGYSVISPLFFKLPQLGRVICCIGAMFLPMLDGGQLLAANDFCQYSFFYCLGVLCAEWINEIRTAKVWQWGLMSVPFIAYSAWVFGQSNAIGFEFPQLGWWSLVSGTAALPFFYLLSMATAKIKLANKSLAAISVNCYWIYLLQMFIIWGCARLVAKTGIVEQLPFSIFLVITAILAILIPIGLATLCRKIFKSPAANKQR